MLLSPCFRWFFFFFNFSMLKNIVEFKEKKVGWQEIEDEKARHWNFFREGWGVVWLSLSSWEGVGSASPHLKCRERSSQQTTRWRLGMGCVRAEKDPGTGNWTQVWEKSCVDDWSSPEEQRISTFERSVCYLESQKLGVLNTSRKGGVVLKGHTHWTSYRERDWSRNR